MTTVKVTLQPAAIVRVFPPGEAPVVVEASASAVVRVLSAGTQGPQGVAGANGAQPVRIDASLGATWILPHTLGRVPLVQVFLTPGELVIADVSADANQITVTHASPRSGFVMII